MSAPALRRPTDPTPRIGVLVVAYNAASTLVSTLERLPDAFRRQVDHVLVSDDCSQDDTYEVGRAVRQRHRPCRMTVIRHEQNLGYGGNQKAGYEWAISHGLDIVVLLHGDGQYAPECIEDLVAPLLSGEADAVFGSRMMSQGWRPCGRHAALQVRRQPDPDALPEHMVGLDLTRVAQRLPRLPRRRARGPRPRVLHQRLRLRHRDHPRTARPGKRIVEVPIPTYYGDEICYVNGLAYASERREGRRAVPGPQMGFGVGAVRSAGLRPETVPALLARRPAALARFARARQGTGRGLLRRAVRLAGPRAGPPRDRCRPARAPRASRSGWTPSTSRTSTQAFPMTCRASSTPSSPATSSST